MSKIDDLIQEYCPDGVEYLQLSECANIIRGKRVTKKDLIEDGSYPVISGGVKPLGYINKYNREPNTITIAQYGTAGYVNMIDTYFWANDVCYCIYPLNNINNKYLYYALMDKQELLYSLRTDAIPSCLHLDKLQSVRIPIPPIQVQNEVVNILDKFTELQAELQAELRARVKQYEWYRNDLLSFKDKNATKTAIKLLFWLQNRRIEDFEKSLVVLEKFVEDCKDGKINIEFCKLGDVCTFVNGFGFKSSLFKDKGLPILRITNIKNNQIDDSNLIYFDKSDYKEDLSSFIINKGDIVVAMSGATTGKVGMNKSDNIYYLNQRVGKFIPHSCLNNNYLYHYLLTKTDYFYTKSGGGAQPNLSNKIVNDLEIPILPIEIQNAIVLVLDKFERYANDLNYGLPAEIEKRKLQYEYYRNKLLTFKEKL